MVRNSCLPFLLTLDFWLFWWRKIFCPWNASLEKLSTTHCAYLTLALLFSFYLTMIVWKHIQIIFYSCLQHLNKDHTTKKSIDKKNLMVIVPKVWLMILVALMWILNINTRIKNKEKTANASKVRYVKSIWGLCQGVGQKKPQSDVV